MSAVMVYLLILIIIVKHHHYDYNINTEKISRGFIGYNSEELLHRMYTNSNFKMNR